MIVPVQNYITAILVFLVIEMLLTWGFYGKHYTSACTAVAYDYRFPE